MTSATHYAFSYLITSSAGFGHTIALTSSLFSVLPDIDHPESLIGRIFPGISRHLLRKYGHRTVTHSIFAIALVIAILSPVLLLSKSFYIAAVLAYSSHIFIDLFNRSGVKLLAPYSQKEYISFRTQELRILVSSWQEYLLMFIIVFLAFSISGRTFSFTGAVRSVSKIFYRHYDGALQDFQESSNYVCKAKVTYFDHISREKVTDELTLLQMYPEKAYLYKDYQRIIISKKDINEIEVIKTDKKISISKLAGNDLSELSSIDDNVFISGKITINNFDPGIRNSDYINVNKGINTVTLTLKCSRPFELSQILNINETREKAIEKLQHKLSSYKIEQLEKHELGLKRRMSVLKSRGFYSNYSTIISLDNELKKVQSKIESLRLNEASGSDDLIMKKIEHLNKGFKVFYSLFLYEI